MKPLKSAVFPNQVTRFGREGDGGVQPSFEPGVDGEPIESLMDFETLLLQRGNPFKPQAIRREFDFHCYMHWIVAVEKSSHEGTII